ncbi:Ribosome biogenesis protein WDR12 homolog [Gryllus bimaculatus]|nr:Ribosome biogenesis protein WDR12 homolog [Gryllus bimaculatus]
MAVAQLEIRFITKQQQYAVPDTPFSVAAHISCIELNSLLNELLKESRLDGKWQSVEFDFLVLNEFLRVPLLEHLEERSIPSEGTIDVEYVERHPAPEPQDCLLHDDWVSAVQVKDKWILTGCYDNTLHLWSTKGKHSLTIPVMAKLQHFASHDQTAMLWEWNITSNAVECVHVCRGHERGLECVGVSPNGHLMATAIHESSSEEQDETSAKRIKMEHGKSQVRTPLLTVKGHKEAVSAAIWTDVNEICTASWDHTLRLWDAELGGLKHEIVGNKSFFDADWSPLNRTVVTASADRHVRLYDPRSREGSLVKSTFTSHTQWVQSVRWSTTEENLFISASYDQQVKLWDSRSPKAPLYDLSGHEDKVLCCDWSKPELMVSGGADNTLRIFKAKTSSNK